MNPASAGGGAPPLVFRPSCVMCVSDCDDNAIFTSCYHFVCSRCVAKYPAGGCPRCRKPCNVLRVSNPNVAERIRCDPSRGLTAALQTLEFQRRQEQLSSQRLRELVSFFNQQHRAAAGKAEELKQRLATTESQRAALQSQLEHMQREVQSHGLPIRGAPHPSVVVPQHPLSLSAGGSQLMGGYDLPTSRVVAPSTTPRRAPSHAGSDASSIFGRKRTRPTTTVAQAHSLAHNPPPTAGGDRAISVNDPHSSTMDHRPSTAQQHQQALQMASADRFRLATPAVTLRAVAGETLEQLRPPQPRAAVVVEPSTLPPLKSMLPPPGRPVHHSSSGHSAPFVA